MRKFIFWTAVGLLAIFIGGLTYAYLRSSVAGQFQAQIEADNAQTIVVAAKDIPQRRTIIQSDLTTRRVPLEAVPEGAARAIDDVVGMMTTEDVFTGETVLGQQLAITGQVLQQIALTIPENKVLVPIPLQSQLISTGLVKPGDHVDLFGTYVAEEVVQARLEEAGLSILSLQNARETVALLQDLEVHAIIIEPTVAATTEEQDGVFVAREGGGQSILVALESQDSVVVKYLLDTTGLLDIALRSPNDNQLADVTNVDLFYLANRYGIELVHGDPLMMSEELFEANPGEFIFTGSEPSSAFLEAIDED